MKAALILSALLAAQISFAASNKYQVTGEVVEVTDAMIVVKKGKERFEITKNPETKFQGELKVGDKATVHYFMTATEVEAKAAKKK